VIPFRHRPLIATVDLSAPAMKVGTTRRTVLRGAALFITLYVVASFIAWGIAVTLPDSTEAGWFSLNPELDSASPGTPRAHSVFSRILSRPGLRDLPYVVIVEPIGVPAAWTMQGGRVHVTSGLLTLVKSDIGIATVLAHELGHSERRHTLKRLTRAVFVLLPMNALLGRYNLRGGNEGVRLAELAHDRDQEFEADEFALRRVRDAYGTTEGSLEFFEWVAKQNPTNSAVVRITQTHPLPAERLARLRELQRSLR
jgi:Zn-dependent protease with chaperone function